jgi:hypothetical protein
MGQASSDPDVARFGPLHLLALALARKGRLGLLLQGSSHWQRTPGYTLVPAELPGGVQEPESTIEAALTALAVRWLGQAAQIRGSRQLYGPSAVHTMDRLPANPEDAPLPVLRFERSTPLYVAATPVVRRVIVSVYRVRLAGPPQPHAEAAGLLWLSPAALRLAMRGSPLADLLGHTGAQWHRGPDGAAAPAEALPDDAFIYVPGEYGERHLLRLVAKYGPEALFQGEDGAGESEP